MTENELSNVLIGIFIDIHKEFGPGLLESVYEELIAFELSQRKILFERQVPVPLIHQKVKMKIGFRADIIVENKLIIEIKSVEFLSPVHHKQLLTYLKLTEMKLGLLVNFNVNFVKDGIARVVNKL